MNAFDRLVKIFEEFPGIGPRQARRFVYFLLGKNPEYLSSITEAVSNLKKEMARCVSCFRYFTRNGHNNEKQSDLCSICADTGRDASTLMLVAKDTDLISIERSGAYEGYFFVIGGLIPILEKNPEKRIRGNELLKKIRKSASEGLKEIIIALSATNEGENTSLFIEKLLENELKTYNLRLTHLGRGLSTGAELEYADKDTIKSALENKK